MSSWNLVVLGINIEKRRNSWERSLQLVLSLLFSYRKFLSWKLACSYLHNYFHIWSYISRALMLKNRLNMYSDVSFRVTYSERPLSSIWRASLGSRVDHHSCSLLQKTKRIMLTSHQKGSTSKTLFLRKNFSLFATSFSASKIPTRVLQGRYKHH